MLMRKWGYRTNFQSEFAKAALNSLEDILIVADSRMYQIEYISACAEELLGLQNVTGDSLLSLLEKIEFPEQLLDSVSWRGASGSTESYLKNLLTGESLWCKCSWKLMEICQSESEKLFFYISDRSEELQQFSQLQAELAEARQSNDAKSRFLSTISHDIRTPLNAIIGLTDLAAEHKDDNEKLQDYIHKISQSSNYLLSLLNDVLDMSRIESGRMSLDYESFQMKALLEEVTDIIRPQTDDKEQILETEWIIAHDSVNGDAVRIKQVLINLLSNAAKYTPQGGRLFFQVIETKDKTSVDGMYVNYQMKVYDNGYGMSDDFLKVIFEPFEKERSGIYRGVEGTGLGMAITKNIVDLMEGEISVESRLGEGTVFTVNLPLQLQLQEAASAKEKKAAVGECGDCSGMRILLVEDNEMTADVLRDILELMECTVRWACNGKEAVCLFKENGEQYDVILMDVQMPGMNGYEATKQIRQHSQTGACIPIIALTGNAFAEDIAASQEAGMDLHLSKPVQRRELAEILRKIRTEALTENGKTC